jgi:hypothetical protein
MESVLDSVVVGAVSLMRRHQPIVQLGKQHQRNGLDLYPADDLLKHIDHFRSHKPANVTWVRWQSSRWLDLSNGDQGGPGRRRERRRQCLEAAEAGLIEPIIRDIELAGEVGQTEMHGCWLHRLGLGGDISS